LVFCDLGWAGVALQLIARLPFIAPPPQAAFILPNFPFLFLKVLSGALPVLAPIIAILSASKHR
jgi:hypothetical protein